MLTSILTLFLLFLLVRAVLFLTRAFWLWLGRGKDLERAIDHKQLTQATIDSHLKGVRLTRGQRQEVRRAHAAAREKYLTIMHYGWYQGVFIFTIGSVAGLLLEEAWMFVSAGIMQSRVGLVWGPFSPLYGLGALVLTSVGFLLRRRHVSSSRVFVCMACVGGCLEQLAGWAMFTLFRAQSWTYLGLFDHITQWVAWRTLVIWGILGLLWVRVVMPELLYRIGEPTTRRQVTFALLIAVYLGLDIFMTVSAFYMRAKRTLGKGPANAFEMLIDEHYTNEWMATRFQNMVVGEQLPDQGLPGVNGDMSHH